MKNNETTINVGSDNTSFQSGNFLNALNELVSFYTEGGSSYTISENEIIYCLKLYINYLKILKKG